MKNTGESSSDDIDLQKYASHLLSESLVTGIPSIVKANNWPKKIFKSCTLCFCLAGFIYQTTVFVSFFLMYPSTVDISVEAREEFVVPAITICNNNGIERTKFCKKFPERCTVPSNITEYCEDYPAYCNNEETQQEPLMVPKEMYVGFEGAATLQDFKDLSVKQNLFFNVTWMHTRDPWDDRIGGPFVLFKQKTLGIVCYTINSCVKNCNTTKKMEVTNVIGRLRDPKLSIRLFFDQSESFLPGRVAGGWLSLHSPFDVSNPYYQGYFLKPGRRYSVIFEAEIEELLPSPYSSNCRNYTDDWLKNGWTGPTSEMVCRELCDMEVTRRCCNNCSDKYIDYPQDGDDVCYLDWINCTESYSTDEFRLCAKDCRDECLKYKYPYTVEERPLHEDKLLKQAWHEDQKMTTVELYLHDADIIVYRHRPHYQDIELFSYIGGFIGAWLGVSLVAVMDLFESLWDIGVFALNKRPQKKNNRKEEFF